jgi:trk system potassium uptake protein TrkH
VNFKTVFYLIGRLLCLVAFFLLIPAIISFFYKENETMISFLITAGLSLFLGVFFLLHLRGGKEEPLGIRDGFLLVAMSWLFVSFLGALPFYFTKEIPFFVDAIFESISGFTTTGASILVNIESLDKGLLFWRSFTQWIGGMGIIVLSVAILPQLSVGGLQLMKNEMPGPTFEHLQPRIKQTALSLWKIYFLFSIIATGVLYLLGMPFFDSVCHMFTALGTGGFSTKNASLAFYGPEIQMAVTVFMFLVAMNFVLHYAWLNGNMKKVVQNSEWRFYVITILICFVVVGLELIFRADYAISDALRHSIFQVVSVGSSTGFVTANYNNWPVLSKAMLFLLMIVAGCAGSTAGGFKQIRLLILLKKAKQSITKYIFPRAVVPVKVEKHVVPDDVLSGVSNFFIIYMLIFVAGSLILLGFGLDTMTSFSAVIACLSNIGPGFGGVGAVENYAFLPVLVKIVLCACMIIGRLEIFTILVLFFPATWKK